MNFVTSEDVKRAGLTAQATGLSPAAALPWHEPRSIETLVAPEDEYAPEGMRCSDSILVYNPCDGWHLLWLMMADPLDVIRNCNCYTHWMPGPPEPASFDREAWRKSWERSEPVNALSGKTDIQEHNEWDALRSSAHEVKP